MVVEEMEVAVTKAPIKIIVLAGILLWIGVFISSCQSQATTNKMYIENFEKDTVTVTFEGCEYLLWRGSQYANGMTHKGNCKNPIHRQNQSK
jgi:hypothetical protein